MYITEKRLADCKLRLKLLLFFVEYGVNKRQAILEYNAAKKIYNELLTVYNLEKTCKLQQAI